MAEDSPPDDSPPSSRIARKPLQRSDFEFLSMVGEGATGKVFVVQKKDTRVVYAMKIMKKPRGEYAKRMIREKQNLVAASEHPFILKLHFAFQSPNYLYLVCDFVNGGDLFHHWNMEDRIFSEERVKFLAAELFLAIHHLHECGILHRDLKLENVLLDRFGHIALADFGLSKRLPKGQEGTSSIVGSYHIMPPEMARNIVVERALAYSKGVDWWAYGIMIALMLYGEHPVLLREEEVPEEVTSELICKVIFADFRLSDDTLARSSPNAADFVQKLLVANAADRLGSADESAIQNHPFFEGIDWDALMNRKIEPKASWVPDVVSQTDVSLFDPEFVMQGVEGIEELPDSWANPYVDHGKLAPFKDFHDVNPVTSPHDARTTVTDAPEAPEGGKGKNPTLQTERKRRKRFVPPKASRCRRVEPFIDESSSPAVGASAGSSETQDLRKKTVVFRRKRRRRRRRKGLEDT